MVSLISANNVLQFRATLEAFFGKNVRRGDGLFLSFQLDSIYFAQGEPLCSSKPFAEKIMETSDPSPPGSLQNFPEPS